MWPLANFSSTERRPKLISLKSVALRITSVSSIRLYRLLRRNWSFAIEESSYIISEKPRPGASNGTIISPIILRRVNVIDDAIYESISTLLALAHGTSGECAIVILVTKGPSKANIVQ